MSLSLEVILDVTASTNGFVETVVFRAVSKNQFVEAARFTAASKNRCNIVKFIF